MKYLLTIPAEGSADDAASPDIQQKPDDPQSFSTDPSGQNQPRSDYVLITHLSNETKLF